MLHLEATERYSILERSLYQITSRYISFTYTEYDFRRVAVWYKQEISDSRNIFLCEGPLTSDRSAYTPERIIYSISNRYTICAECIGASNERTCFYTLGAKTLIFSVPANISITYNSDRSSWLHKDPITQRRCCITLQCSSEIQTYINRYSQTYIYSNNTTSSITYHSDRNVYIETQLTYSMRNSYIVLGVISDRYTYIKKYSSTLIYSPVVQSTIDDFISERNIILSIDVNYNERYILCTRTPFSERTMYVTLRMVSDRAIAVVVYSHNWLYSAQILQARPTPSERVCTYVAVIYNTERNIFVEQRDVYATKNPDSLQDTTILYSKLDDVANTSFSLDRNVELSGSQITNYEINNKLITNKVLLSAQSPYFSISAVDDKGASVITSNTPQIKTKLTCTYFTLDITFT